MTQHELDQVVAAWLRALPGLLEQHRGQWAVFTANPFSVIGIYPDSGEARTAGYTGPHWKDFMIRQVMPDPAGEAWLAQHDAAEAEYASWVCEPARAWKPTAAAINALPDGVRDYVRDLETLADPAGIVAQNTLLRDQLAQLQRFVEEVAEPVWDEYQEELEQAIERVALMVWASMLQFGRPDIHSPWHAKQAGIAKWNQVNGCWEVR